jgi:PmbA protein
MPQKIENILQQAAEICSAAELFHQSGEVRTVRFENNKLKRIDARQYEGVGLRVFAEGRIGFASTTDLRDPQKLVRMALASAEFGEKPRFELPDQPAHIPAVKTNDPAAGEVTQQQLVEMGHEALIMSRETNDEFLFSASLSTRTGTERILNSSGLDFSQTSTSMSAGAEIQEVRDSGLLQVHEYKSWGRPFESIRDVAGEALEKMEKGRVVASPGRDVMPMIFTPKAVDNLLSPIMTALNGKLVHKGSSILAGRIGERIIDPRISICDDPTIHYAPASGPVDNEGLPARRLPLVQNGVLKNYLLDLQTSALLEM